MSEEEAVACPACGGTDLTQAAETLSIPVHVGLLWPTAEEARRCPKGDMTLMFCRSCGFLHNSTFEEERVDYGLSYDNALHFSEVFREYEVALARRLIETHRLRGKRIVEIGCDSARFLGLLCMVGANRGIGFDPSHDPGYLDEFAVGRVEVRQELFSEESLTEGADLVCGRHVLEHIPRPRDFLRTIREAIRGDEAVVYFEVPSALLLLEQLSIWDLAYEHCGYYTAPSLRRLFQSCGFEVMAIEETYGKQFLALEARSAGEARVEQIPREVLGSLVTLVEKFGDEVRSKRAIWDARLHRHHERSERVVVWGAGAKGVGFMNLVSNAEYVHALVDVNPRKQGTFMAGTGHRIVPPEDLKRIQPDLVLVANPLYTEEITAQVSALGLTAANVESVS